MNNYSDSPTNELSRPEADFGAEVDERVRLNPGTSLLVALGIGFLIGALIQVLRPAPKPQQRLVRFLQEMEDSLRHASAPALSKVSDLAAGSAQALGHRLHRGEAQVEKLLRSATRQLRRFVP